MQQFIEWYNGKQGKDKGNYNVITGYRTTPFNNSHSVVINEQYIFVHACEKPPIP